MCSIIISNHHNKEFPLIIAANRDEDYARASTPPQILTTEPHLIMGGKDELKGGTWLAVNKYSLFAAITNQGPTNKKLKTSRGHIILEALKCKTIEELLAFVEEFNPAEYNGFNIIFGNQEKVYVGHSYIIHAMVIRELPKGISLITNDIKFSGTNETALYIHRTLAPLADTSWIKYYKTAKSLLSSFDLGIRIKATKKKDINGKIVIGGRCTKSSAILAFSNDGLARYKFHDRTVEQKPRKDSVPLIPKYKDYIDLWRGVSSEKSVSEETDDVMGESVKLIKTTPSNRFANSCSNSITTSYYDKYFVGFTKYTKW